MSDTPRTDLFERARKGAPAKYKWAKHDYEEALEFARKLEREVNALRHDIGRALANHNADLNRRGR